MVIFFEFLPTFAWRATRFGKSKILLEQSFHLRYVYRFAIVIMSLINLTKGLILAMFFFNKDLNFKYLSYITTTPTGATDAEKRNNLMKQGGFSLVAESILLIMIANNIKKYRPLVLSVKDVIFYKERMEWMMNFVSPVFEICVFLTVAYVKDFFGFVLAFFACLVSFCQIPSFDQHHIFKVLTFAMFNVVAWTVFISSLLISTDDPPSYFKETLNIVNPKVRTYLGGYLAYSKNSLIQNMVLDYKNLGMDFIFNMSVLVFAFVSGFILYHLKIGSLCETTFKDQVIMVKELPPQTTFKETHPKLEDEIKESYYINYFVKKVALIQDLDINLATNDKDELQVEYIKTIPYLDLQALTKKIKLYKKYKKRTEMDLNSLSKKFLQKIWGFFLETIVNILTISNIVYASLFAYVAFFFYFKNQNPSLFSFLPFVGIFLLGISQFKTFIFYSQFLVGIPMIINFMMFYFSNIELDIANCRNDSIFYCQPWFGMIYRRGVAGVTSNKIFLEMLVKIFLFQGIFFFYRMLKFTGELFVEKTDKELNLEIEDSFNRGSLPFIRIVIIQIASKFYIVCFALLLYIGTSQPTYTNMCLLIVAITYMAKFKLVKKWWIIVYIMMNIIFISAYFIDLFLSNSQKQAHEKLLNLIGLPINSIENPGQKPNALSEKNLTNKVLIMVLYISCLIQQIAGRNRYIKCYLIKLNKIKNEDWLVSNMNSWKQKLKNMTIKVYYKSGVWMSYALNIYLPLFQSISVGRAFLLISIITAFIVHINALRTSRRTGKIYLNTTYTCWKVFLVLKVLNLCLLMVGAFGLNEKIREYLNIVKDSEDYEYINYLGIESLESEIIRIIPTLQNCSQNIYIKTNKLRFYFIIECLTFVLTKIAMKIIQIQRVYNNNLYGAVSSLEKAQWLKQKKPKLFRIFKVYHKYIIGGKLVKNKKTNKIISSFSGFLARIYTSVIYFITLSISVFQNISLLMLVSLFYFLRYFIKMNKIFLDYLTGSSVEKVISIKMEHFHEKYLSSSALHHKDGLYDEILKNEALLDDKHKRFTNEEIRRYSRIDLFSLALNLRLEITKYDGDNKYKLFLVTLIVTTSILVLTYINALLQNILFNTPSANSFIKWLKIVSTIFGFKYYKNEATCLADQLVYFILLFILLAYDVYVIRVIASLQKDIRAKLELIENKDEEFKRETAKERATELVELNEAKIARMARSTNNDRDKKNKKGDDLSDVDSENEQEFLDIFNLNLGADEKELALDKIDIENIMDLVNNKDVELALLDDQDRQEIKIRALRKGTEDSLKKYTCYDNLEELDLHRWNFYEFYWITSSNEETKFRKYMMDMRKFKNRPDESSSESEAEGQDSSESEEFSKSNKKKESIYPNMNDKHNILIYYHRNQKKLSWIRILKFFLDLQQRFIGAIFVLILLHKNTFAVVVVYWLYIIYFYSTEHNAKQLKITNFFIAVVTLLQYIIILLQQQIPNVQANKEEIVSLIDYIWILLIDPNEKLTIKYEGFFKITGVLGLNQNSLLYDSIPTILFQVTIFYYDFFLLYIAEKLETVLLKVRREIFFIQHDPSSSKLLYMINYKYWKDMTTYFLSSIESICVVRLIEIVVIILLVLNIFYASPIWNFFRLALLFFAYSNIAFRTLSDYQIVRNRLGRLLFFAMLYLWLRVILASFIDVYIYFKGSVPVGSTLNLLTISYGEKFILVIEFFLIEYTNSIYFSEDFIEYQVSLIKKKVVRSTLVGISITYDHNESKLMNYIQGFSERIKLEEDIMRLRSTIEE